jgi:hypothetical protein
MQLYMAYKLLNKEPTLTVILLGELVARRIGQLFLVLKRNLGGHKCKDVTTAATQWLIARDTNLHQQGIDTYVQ